MGLWIGWMVAAIAALAIGLLWQWLQREMAERAEVEQEHAALDARLRELRDQHDQIMKVDHLAGLGQLLTGAASQVTQPITAAREQSDELAEQWIECRNLIAAYDEAIQACLAPLDMLVGTDAAALDPDQLQLVVQHVARWRGRLFEARAALMANPFDGEAPPRLRAIREQLDRAAVLLTGLDSGPRPGEVGADDVDIAQALDAALAMAAARLGNRVTVVRRYCESPLLSGSVAQIRQMALHLVINACEAISGDGVLTLETRLADGILEIDVADTGIGISDEILPRVFEPYFTTRPAHQIGLGLATVHRIVKAHRGSIQVRTQPGSGTRFTVTLPLAERPSGVVTPLFRHRESA